LAPVKRGLYDDPKIYDILSTPGSSNTARGLLRIARRHGLAAGGRWLEPGCGTGRLLLPLARRGFPVIGFDRSPAMIDFAAARFRRAGLRARLFSAEMTAFADSVRGRPVAFAFNLDNTVRHLDDDPDLLEHLSDMARVLRPGGLYAVGLSLMRPGQDEITEDFWSAARGRCRVDHLVQYLPPGGRKRASETVIHHVSVTRPRGIERFDAVDRLRAWTAAEWKDLVRQAGWETVATVDEDGDPIDPEVFDYAVHLLRPLTGGRSRRAAGRDRPTSRVRSSVRAGDDRRVARWLRASAVRSLP
jgi:SAM-dependent methyltransferase